MRCVRGICARSAVRFTCFRLRGLTHDCAFCKSALPRSVWIFIGTLAIFALLATVTSEAYGTGAISISFTKVLGMTLCLCLAALAMDLVAVLRDPVAWPFRFLRVGRLHDRHVADDGTDRGRGAREPSNKARSRPRMQRSPSGRPCRSSRSWGPRIGRGCGISPALWARNWR